jgi:beta-N-acetylhexosaminidase
MTERPHPSRARAAAVLAAFAAAAVAAACGGSEVRAAAPVPAAGETTTAAPASRAGAATTTASTPASPLDTEPPAPVGGASVTVAATELAPAVSTSRPGPPVTDPAVRPPSSPTTNPTPPPPTPSACLDRLSVRFRAAQVVWPGIQGNRLVADAAWFADLGIGGAMVMTPPPGYDPGAITTFKTAGRVPLLIATDEEGGRVQRLSGLGPLPPALTVGTTWTIEQTRSAFAAHGAKLKAFGIDIVFGPVVDVAPPGGGGPIGDRLFGSDPNTVTAYANAVSSGWRDAGIVPTLKHFPGHGAATADTHVDAAVTAPLAALEARDLLPYRNLAGQQQAVMVAHLDVPGLTVDGDTPTSLSVAALALLRSRYGYSDALVFTDALEMGAVAARYDLPEAGVRALMAGADVALHNRPYRTPEMIDALVVAAESGRLPTARLNDAAGRILRLKGVDPCTLVGG